MKHSHFTQTPRSPLPLFPLRPGKKANYVTVKSGNEGGDRSGKRSMCKRWAKIPVKTFPIKKIINTELFINGKEGLYIQKEGSDQEDRMKKKSDLLEEGRILAGNKCSGSENSDSLFRWTYNYWEEKLFNSNLFETTLNYGSEKYRSAKNRVNELVQW